jgi:hypothetical protein
VYLILPAALWPYGPMTVLTEMTAQEFSWRVKRGRLVKMTTSPPSVNRLSRQCGSLDILQPYEPTQPTPGMAYAFGLTATETPNLPLLSSVLRLITDDILDEATAYQL